MKFNKRNIIIYFSKLIENYLIEAIPFLAKNKNLQNIDYIVIKGIHLITHIFKISLIQLQDIQSSVALTTTGFEMYLEYMEQTYKSPIISDLNIMDAMKFVFSKTIDFPKETPPIEPEIIQLLNSLLISCNTFLDWEKKEFTIERKIQKIQQGDFIQLLSSVVCV
jgi:hypothetical protein